MRRAAATLLVVLRMTLGILALGGGVALADELKMVGVITHLDISGADAQTATATLKDNKSEKELDITVNDKLTLDKFKDHRIVEGDEIKCKYEVKGKKNVSTFFRKTAGC